MICPAYNNHLHCNSGTHLDGGVDNDTVWQRRWQRIKNLPMTWYDIPQVHIGRRFVQWMTMVIKGVRTRVCNSEHPLI